jgi:hypothetical protein
VAELVDALASGASGLTAVKVRVLSWAPSCAQTHDIPEAQKRVPEDGLVLRESAIGAARSAGHDAHVPTENKMMPIRFTTPFILVIAAMVFAQLSSAQAQAADPCSGHQLLPTPRAEESCLTLRPQVHPSPDKALRAVIFPVGMDLHASPDIESRVVIRGPDAKLVTSKDFSSPRGANGYYVVRAKWSPDSQFFVFSVSSSGGHSPWSFPTWVFSRQKEAIVSFSDMIGGKPTLSDEFNFSGPHHLTAATREKEGSDKQVPVVVDLEAAIKKIAPDK